MFPKPVRKILLVAIMAGLVYYGFSVVSVHSSGEVIAFKQFASAVMDGDVIRGRKLLEKDEPKYQGPLTFQKRRKKELEGCEVRFVYYKVRRMEPSKDGKTVNLVVNQIIHLDRPGSKTFWGNDTIINPQTVTMVKVKSTWKVRSFIDSFYSGAIDR